jgi:hypothetical protein
MVGKLFTGPEELCGYDPVWTIHVELPLWHLSSAPGLSKGLLWRRQEVILRLQTAGLQTISDSRLSGSLAKSLRPCAVWCCLSVWAFESPRIWEFLSLGFENQNGPVTIFCRRRLYNTKRRDWKSRSQNTLERNTLLRGFRGTVLWTSVEDSFGRNSWVI